MAELILLFTRNELNNYKKNMSIFFDSSRLSISGITDWGKMEEIFTGVCVSDTGYDVGLLMCLSI